MLKELLETKHCFKLVCGAGNEDIEEIKRLVYLYAVAGCHFHQCYTTYQPFL